MTVLYKHSDGWKHFGLRAVLSNENQSTEKVSVILPVYNCADYLQAAVESIIDQTLKSWRLIIVNDGSTDGSAEYLDSLTDPRVTVLHQENKGLSFSLNRGLEHSKTEFIARMDGDDFAYPERLEKQLAFMEANPEVGLLGTQIQRVGMKRADSGSALPTTHDEIFATLMNGGHGICHPTIMCRRSIFDQIGGYKSGLGEEWDIFLRFGEISKLANLNDCLLKYRYHGSSINGSRMMELRRRIRYQCECSRRRMSGLEPIAYEDFLAGEQQESFLKRWQRSSEDYSRASYHAAMADILGEHPVRGYARLGVAAASAPQLVLHRIQQKLAGPKAKKTAKQPQQP